ncbi:hypothetical protein PVAP13_5NG197300 [Panicum virgatum]|uniref:Glycoside hydrolase family 3 N-terminal domain-containing protein n=1 Tax=Panicum virgatum TaxID=38727 RepID=A0A8T0RV01_PANVG|nr:hypothetical protein PVAP13_5NG197300 [Panicum virgatum]
MGIPPAGGGTGSSCGRVVAAAASLVLLIQLISGCVSPAAAGGGGEQQGAKYKDPKQPLHARVDDLLRRMTLAEKIGQMSQIDQENATADVISNYFIGSVLRGGGSVPAADAPPEAWVEMVDAIQRTALSTRLGIPAMFGIDAVHGHGYVYKATVFPHNVGLGCTRDPELAKKIGAAVALEVRATGIPFIFAPCLAVCRDPRWGRCYESFSEEPKLNPFIAGQRNVAACAKHYVGDGGTTRGINENNTVATFHQLLGIHMPPYYSAVIQGVSTIMVSYSSWNGVKMHANRFLVTDFLKNKLRFRGFVVSDWLGLDRITSPEHADYPLSVKLGILAGIDMVMIPYQYKEFRDDLTTLVQNGSIPMSRIDDAVRRILRVKFTLGLFENPYADTNLAVELGNQEHRDLAREAVRKSLVLLKNGKPGDTPLLPLPKKAHGGILVAGSHADDLGSQCGGWTIKWQGLTGNNLTAGTTILDGIKRAVVAETAGDNLNLTIPAPGPAVIRNVCGGIRCVVVLVSGRPLVGQGVADVLLGDYGFTGKLSRTWFRSVEQLPMNVGDAHYDPLFPFGFGLETRPLKT